MSLQDITTMRKDKNGSLGELRQFSTVALTLVKKYGSKSLTGDLLPVVSKSNEEFGSFVTLLHHLDKLNVSSLQSLIGLLKDSDEVKNELNNELVVTSSHPDAFSPTDKSVSKISSDRVQLEVRGSGSIYKRTLDGDLEKMLS